MLCPDKVTNPVLSGPFRPAHVIGPILLQCDELRVSGGVGGWNGHGHGGRRERRPGPVTPVGTDQPEAGSAASSGPGEPTRPARPQIWAGFLWMGHLDIVT
jgi:hypothetical protein